jgi:hypothetical protein
MGKGSKFGGGGLIQGVKNTLAHKNAVCQVAHRTPKGLQIFIFTKKIALNGIDLIV